MALTILAYFVFGKLCEKKKRTRNEGCAIQFFCLLIFGFGYLVNNLFNIRLPLIGVVHTFWVISNTFGHTFSTSTVGSRSNVSPELNELGSKLFTTFFDAKFFSYLGERVG